MPLSIQKYDHKMATSNSSYPAVNSADCNALFHLICALTVLFLFGFTDFSFLLF